jgi:hypothetical protein
MRPDLRATALLCSVLAFALAGVAQAQFIRPGSGLEQEETRTVISLKKSAASALWRLGPFRVTPVVALQDLRYDSTARSPTSDAKGDVTATIGAGFEAYLPVGSKSALSFAAIPAYTFWKEFTEQNRLVGSYRASFRGGYNRARLSLDAAHIEDLEFANPELLQRLPQERLNARANLEIDLTRNFGFEFEARRESTRLSEPEAGFEPGLDTLRRLDRDADRGRAGLLWHSGGRFRLGLGVQREVRKFSTADRSNEGDSPYLTVAAEGNHLSASIDLVQRSLESRGGSSFEGVDQTTGRFGLSLFPGWRLSYSVYGGRAVGYSFDGSQSHLEDTRLGVGLGLKASDRASIRVWSEQGNLTYTPIGGSAAKPDEDLTAYGGDLLITVSERSSIRFRGGHMELDSPLPGADREWDFFTAGISITFSKVRIEVGTGG